MDIKSINRAHNLGLLIEEMRTFEDLRKAAEEDPQALLELRDADIELVGGDSLSSLLLSVPREARVATLMSSHIYIEDGAGEVEPQGCPIPFAVVVVVANGVYYANAAAAVNGAWAANAVVNGNCKWNVNGCKVEEYVFPAGVTRVEILPSAIDESFRNMCDSIGLINARRKMLIERIAHDGSLVDASIAPNGDRLVTMSYEFRNRELRSTFRDAAGELSLVAICVA